MTVLDQQPVRTLSDAAVTAFRDRFGERFITSMAVREHHGTDESPYPVCPPEAVIFPRDTEEVVAAVNICNQHKVPVIPFGIGSSLEGHVLPIEGGITLDFSEMNKVLAINAEDFTVTVQPGVIRTQLNDEIRHTGLFFPIDPGAHASIGGMTSTRASGTNAVRYGTMRENVVSMKVVTAGGKVIRTSSRARKSSSGYDLTRLFVGSEGTLGIIVEITVRVYPQPEAVTAAICNFPTLESAVQSVIEIMQSGVAIARVEFMDTRAVKAVNAYSKLTLKETPLLLFEFHGSETGVREQAEIVQEIARDNGGMDFEWAEKSEDRKRLWTARHNSHYSGLQLRPGSRSVATDVCVPISRLAECVSETAQELEGMPFPYTIVGHVGDGNFHVQMLIDPDSREEWEMSEDINRRLVSRAIRMDGTCSGEHGVGIHKMAFLKEEHGEDALELMRLIKHAYDPNNIFNPGKLVSWHA
ncbi:D-lactate dehydrogenase [Advenella kashmirensis W13003]|uniref:D-lactate dehydrogenase (cytochrome) n=1 Tax=Advenella kashmirensis W13003 TaxID=1424334 RepID=V8QY59_9BURK|nr:FAD-linked oxidase C-terminal domain-containing protein [Advenella kashmirensis]ETF04552.1 D-lactate dehydrogenase [Advenella kashmirensis W13003]